ncbi:MAG: hypothetical protein ACREVE_12080 [Gammaproteobacteria bacterium]
MTDKAKPSRQRAEGVNAAKDSGEWKARDEPGTDAPRSEEDKASSSSVPDHGTIKTAFALGGLAGNNAHGAGFLQAALDCGTCPELISCTSGQILWVYRYLEANPGNSSEPDMLREHLERDVNEFEKTPWRDLNLMTANMFGKASIFRPARHEYFLDLAKNTMNAVERAIKEWPKLFVMREFMSGLPARTLVPLFPKEFFEDISDAFNRSDIGIMFNSYDPVQGMEIVHLNPRAQELLDRNPGDRSRHRSRTLYKRITPEYVRNGLWLYQYGFEDCAILDGAFFRQIILWELKQAEDIYVIRPIKYKWIGALPTSYIDMEDMKTEIAFNGAYQGERDKLLLMQHLRERVEESIADPDIKKKILNDPYINEATLHEIEIETQESFYDYVFEDVRVFERARELGRMALTGQAQPDVYAIDSGLPSRSAAAL